VTLLSAAEQAAIYDDYWARGRCAEIAAHSGALALCHFDAVFNGGGVEILEREIGELTPDQVLTDDELAAVVSLLAPYNVFPDGETGEAGACGAYCEARLARFRRLHNAAAEPGWEVRLNRVASYCDLTWRVT
jgi:hypothetical protein